MTGTKQPDLVVDPGVAYSGSARVVDGNTLAAVKEAYNQAAERFDRTRTAVMIEVLVRVAPQVLDFESDTPLSGGACNLDGPCESCQ